MAKVLKDIKLEKSYSSDNSNILDDFYIPVLSVAKKYCRLTGYFSTSSLAVAAEGISEIIENDGKIELITGFFTNKEDIIVAEEVLKDPSKFVKSIENTIDQFNDINDMYVKEAIKAFAWLLAKGLLDIKIALPKLKYKENYKSIFHQKIGIIEDAAGDSISFSGSINETGSGWVSNIENFKVFRSWEGGENKYFTEDKKTFLRFWNNLTDKIVSIPLSKALKEKMILLAPAKKEDIDLRILRKAYGKSRHVNREQIKLPTLRNYQSEAIESWVRNNQRGILEMATGTGKTVVGIKAIEKFFTDKEKGITLVLAPTNEICSQWHEKIEIFIKPDQNILVGSKHSTWKKMVEKSLHDYEKGRSNKLIFISTYESLSNLFKILNEYNLSSTLLIGDEVHSFGSTERSKVLSNENFDKKILSRLGLSATPERLFDEVGNEAVSNFFGGTIYRFTIGDAIKNKILSPYEYHLNVIDMDREEYKLYIQITKKIGKSFHFSKENSDYLTILTNQRAKLIKASLNKIKEVEKIIKELHLENDTRHTLIFCIDSNQLNKVINTLNKYRITYSKITGEESYSDRSSILEGFSRGNIDVLLSMKILDEGIDIPEIKNAIIMSSSRSPREYIQRRGRVLRKPDYPKLAKIYDFLTIPPDIDHDEEDIFEIEKQIVRKEILRIFEFAKYSRNWRDIFNNDLLDRMIKKYKLSEMYNLLVDNK